MDLEQARGSKNMEARSGWARGADAWQSRSNDSGGSGPAASHAANLHCPSLLVMQIKIGDRFVFVVGIMAGIAVLIVPEIVVVMVV